MKAFKRLVGFVGALILLTTVPMTASAYNNIPYSSYTYNYDGDAVMSPHAYIPATILKGKNFGLADFSTPEDMCTDKSGNIYIADTGNKRVVKISADFSEASVISKFEFEGENYALTKPTGLYVTEEGELYIADSSGINIYVFSKELTCIRVIKKPESKLLPSDFSYIPSKIAVDKAGRIYVVSLGNTYGVVALNKKGEYSTFIGAQKVTLSVADKLWRKFMTKEQKKRTLNYVPTNYNNITIDEKGFLYVTAAYSNINAVVQTIKSRSTDNRYAMIKKLNSNGEDVLLRSGDYPPGGDVDITLSTDGNSTNNDILYGPSVIVDAAVSKDGVYSLADKKRGKIFTYDSNGNLLYAFGGTGYQAGLFSQLCAIDYDINGRLLALDGNAGSVTVFEKTDYGQLVQKAINLTNNRKYQESVPIYREILLENSNFDLANTGIGTAMMRQGDYKEAMRYFKLANNTEQYSEAYSTYRKELLGNKILIIPVIVAAVCLLIAAFFRFAGKYNAKTNLSPVGSSGFASELMFGFHTIFHPFNGFWELKRSKRGSVRAAATILALAVASLLFRMTGTGYIYSGAKGDFNLISSLLTLLGIVAVWCISNWCLTSLMYGEGSLKDIFIASCYALMPIIFFTVPATIFSNFVTLNEVMFVNFFYAVGYIWAAILLFCAILSTHDYQLGTNVITVVLTVVGMIIIIFLMLLFVNLLGRMGAMITNIYNEITFRM